MTLGKRIKEKREEAGITQAELARRIGTTKQTLFKYENNIITNVPSDKIEKIADVLSVNAAYLMGWTDEPNIDWKLAEKQKQQWDAFAKKHNENFYQIQLLTSFNELNDDNKNKAISYTENLLKMQELENEQKIFLNAAHERTDITFTEEERLADEKMIEEDED